MVFRTVKEGNWRCLQRVLGLTAPMADSSHSRFRRIALCGGLVLAAVLGILLAGQPLKSRDATPGCDGGVASPVAVARTPAPDAARPPRPAITARADFAPGALFAYVQPANAAALDAALPAPARALRYVRLNSALLAGLSSPFGQKPGAGRVELPLADGGALAVVIDASEHLGAERWTSVGHLEGRPESRAIFACNEGFLHGSIVDADLGEYALRVATANLSQFYRVDPALVPPCGGERHPTPDARLRAADAPPPVRAAESMAVAVSSTALTAGTVSAAATPAEVHIMILYTQAVMPTLTGAARAAALQSAFDAAIARVNSAFDASLVAVHVKLVRTAETYYAPDGPIVASVAGFNDAALTALQSATDGQMDEIHALRDQSGADLVCLALNRPDAASSGLAFLLDTPGDRTNASFGFSVVQASLFGSTDVFTHELGHNFGCAHDRPNAYGPGAFSYSYGYNFFASDGQQYHDIMAYPPGRGISYFSNPAISAPAPAPANSPGGVAVGQTGESDCARTIGNTVAEVANFRPAMFSVNAQPISQSAGVGGNVTFTTTATAASGGAGPTYQWQFNGTNLTGATNSAFTVASLQPANTGLYLAAATSGSTITSDAAILGVSITSKLAGAAQEIGPNLAHSNGNIYDQVLLQGAAATITADPGQITRLSYVDLTDDIVQVEFSGAGSLSLLLDTPSGPAPAVNYNQPAVPYMKGHAGIVIVDANETTNLSVFSVGRITGSDPSLFKSGVTYDGVADLAFVAILSANGKFGGLRTADAGYFAAKGLTGIYAPGVQFLGPVYASDINASAAATPVFIIGSSPDTRITGGDLLQANGQPVKVGGLTHLQFSAGTKSSGVTLPAQTNRAVLQQNGADVTAQVVANPVP